VYVLTTTECRTVANNLISEILNSKDNDIPLHLL